MKKFIAIILIVVSVFAIISAAAEETRNRVGFICDINEDEDLIVIMDCFGLFVRYLKMPQI